LSVWGLTRLIELRAEVHRASTILGLEYGPRKVEAESRWYQCGIMRLALESHGSLRAWIVPLAGAPLPHSPKPDALPKLWVSPLDHCGGASWHPIERPEV
jgi:hypothetical protein